jgi:dTDP-4-amino-4,6-dideoxygalactose transaminase
VVRYFDANPVFVDILPASLNLNPDLIEAAITQRTKAIIPVHIAGLPADLASICDIAERHDLAVIEDAAHALPSKYKGRPIGTTAGGGQPAAVCFSFYATKTITTAEGGMICTDEEDLAERCRIMALHGISRDAWKRYTAEGSWYYEIVAPGFKYNMTDIAAAMGLAQLRKADHMWQRRCEIARRYNEAFGLLPELQIPADRPDCQHAWHLYVLRLNLDRLHLDRAQFMQELKRRNIGTSVHFIPLHLQPYYQQTYGYTPADFPVALREYQRAISLPIYSRMSDEDVQDVISAVLQVAREAEV